MKKKVARARISPEMWTRLNNGETVTVRIPADVCELRLSLHDGDEFSHFDRLFDDLWRKLFPKRFTSWILR